MRCEADTADGDYVAAGLLVVVVAAAGNVGNRLHRWSGAGGGL